MPDAAGMPHIWDCAACRPSPPPPSSPHRKRQEAPPPSAAAKAPVNPSSNAVGWAYPWPAGGLAPVPHCHPIPPTSRQTPNSPRPPACRAQCRGAGPAFQDLPAHTRRTDPGSCGPHGADSGPAHNIRALPIPSAPLAPWPLRGPSDPETAPSICENTGSPSPPGSVAAWPRKPRPRTVAGPDATEDHGLVRQTRAASHLQSVVSALWEHANWTWNPLSP